MSDRAIPFLVFNMAIRGVNAVIVHCDSLSRESVGVFYIQNDDDNAFTFSSVNIMPYSEAMEKEFNVLFTDKRYPAHVESPNPFKGVL
jgi:hypothetical protein